MASRANLASVPAGDTPVPEAKADTKKKTSVAEAAESGSRRDLLVAMRARIAETVTGKCPPRDLASLTRRLDDIDEQIRSIDLQAKEEGGESGSVDDDAFDPSAV